MVLTILLREQSTPFHEERDIRLVTSNFELAAVSINSCPVCKLFSHRLYRASRAFTFVFLKGEEKRRLMCLNCFLLAFAG